MAGSAESGSGLGLAIVRRIAELHGADVVLGAGTGSQGLQVDISFPRDAQA
ncbi:MAG: hypothetical protein ACRET8_09125 [Burkholderiales bacterium]